MARNVELKARVADVTPLIAALAPLASSPPSHLTQEDTFFACARGRLKLRRFSDTAGELIHYERADEPGPRVSTYRRVPTSAPDLVREVLGAAGDPIAVVRKRRRLQMVGRTRVHLDDVEGLGTFVELEVVLADDEAVATGLREAHALMVALGIREDDLVSQAYVDLLLGRDGTTASPRIDELSVTEPA